METLLRPIYIPEPKSPILDAKSKKLWYTIFIYF